MWDECAKCIITTLKYKLHNLCANISVSNAKRTFNRILGFKYRYYSFVVTENFCVLPHMQYMYRKRIKRIHLTLFDQFLAEKSIPVPLFHMKAKILNTAFL